MSNIYEKLEALQNDFKAPKTEYNAHGGFKYRTLEKMQETLKPLLKKHKAILLLSDKAVESGGRPHIEATATLVDLEDVKSQIVVTALAQEAEIQKGMQQAQISGSTSSYARKYALSGLLLVDDTDELDKKEGEQIDWQAEIEQSKNINALMKVWNKMPADTRNQFIDLFAERKFAITEVSNDSGA